MPTREILWNVDTLARIAVYVMLALPVGVLAFGLARCIRMWRLGSPEDRFHRLGTRLWGALTRSIFHGRIVRRRNLYRGLMHLGIFWGFVILLIGTIIVMIEDDITRPILGISFYRGDFYLIYKLAMNCAGLLLIAGVAMAYYRRWIQTPATQETAPDDLLLLSPGEGREWGAPASGIPKAPRNRSPRRSATNPGRASNRCAPAPPQLPGGPTAPRRTASP
jgi:nitrate reductase gamma subunit